MPISAVQKSDSVLHTYIHSLFILFPIMVYPRRLDIVPCHGGLPNDHVVVIALRSVECLFCSLIEVPSHLLLARRTSDLEEPNLWAWKHISPTGSLRLMVRGALLLVYLDS